MPMAPLPGLSSVSLIKGAVFHRQSRRNCSSVSHGWNETSIAQYVALAWDSTFLRASSKQWGEPSGWKVGAYPEKAPHSTYNYQWRSSTTSVDARAARA